MDKKSLDERAFELGFNSVEEMLSSMEKDSNIKYTPKEEVEDGYTGEGMDLKNIQKVIFFIMIAFGPVMMLLLLFFWKVEGNSVSIEDLGQISILSLFYFGMLFFSYLKGRYWRKWTAIKFFKWPLMILIVSYYAIGGSILEQFLTPTVIPLFMNNMQFIEQSSSIIFMISFGLFIGFDILFMWASGARYEAA